MATLIKVDGTSTEVQPKNGKFFSLKEMQGYVDGYIECLPFGSSQLMVINEEGKFTKKQNIKASMLAIRKRAIYPWDYIAGDVLICNNEEVQ